MFGLIYNNRWGLLIGSVISTYISIDKEHFWGSFMYHMVFFIIGYTLASIYIMLKTPKKEEEDDSIN